MEINIKLSHPDAVVPSYSMQGDAGLDMTAVEKVVNTEHNFIEYNTGISVELPRGFVGFIYPRSSISKTDMMLCNHVAVIDSNFRGVIKLRFKLTSLLNHGSMVDYEIGDRIGQLVITPYPEITFNEVETLNPTNRNSNGFGSSGR